MCDNTDLKSDVPPRFINNCSGTQCTTPMSLFIWSTGFRRLWSLSLEFFLCYVWFIHDTISDYKCHNLLLFFCRRPLLHSFGHFHDEIVSGLQFSIGDDWDFNKTLSQISYFRFLVVSSCGLLWTSLLCLTRLVTSKFTRSNFIQLKWIHNTLEFLNVFTVSNHTSFSNPFRRNSFSVVLPLGFLLFDFFPLTLCLPYSTHFGKTVFPCDVRTPWLSSDNTDLGSNVPLSRGQTSTSGLIRLRITGIILDIRILFFPPPPVNCTNLDTKLF